MRRLVTTVAVVIAALALVGAALAAGGQKSGGYKGQGENVQGQLGAQGGVAGSEVSSGTLPFTGQDLTLFAVAGVALILAGSGFYRLSRRRQ